MFLASVNSETEKEPESSTHINAFELIGMSSCLDLSWFFEKEDVSERKVRLTSTCSPRNLLERIENTVSEMGFGVQKKNRRLKVLEDQKGQRKSCNLSVTAEMKAEFGLPTPIPTQTETSDIFLEKK
ncbi:hypothetical protein L6452_02658 [Arctium lappa]|uniref:Uncharacterized protein n=1 Tax=Arctium lappa TaxID=4217 RepID=A0ACB9FKM6_ARCLA|nr:hypothetical protein L6452_02658 [Arctium lappa]